jgi:hypothetical protein
VHVVNGKIVSRSQGLQPDDTIFVNLNAADILSITLRSKTEEARATLERVLETIKFSR